MTLRSTISPSRFKYAVFGSSDPAITDADAAFAGGALSAATISASIFLVASGKAGHPSGVENLIPLYSGGLCEAVKLIAPSDFDSITAYEIAGVGAASAITSGVIPCAVKISAAIEHSVSPRKRGSRPTITFALVGFCERT